VKPSAGRIVHYVAEDGGSCRAAIITQVTSEIISEVGLAVFAPSGLSFKGTVRLAGLIPNTAMYAAGTWHWPERTD
jgi:hypothetical protein